MDYVPAFAVQVDSFLTNGRRDQDLWSVGCVKPQEVPIAILSSALNELNNIAVVCSSKIAGKQLFILLPERGFLNRH